MHRGLTAQHVDSERRCGLTEGSMLEFFSSLNLKKTWTCLICRKGGVLIYSDLSSLMSLRYKHLQMITISIKMLQHRVTRTFLWWKSGSRFFPFLGFTVKCLVSSIMAPPSFLPGKYPQSNTLQHWYNATQAMKASHCLYYSAVCLSSSSWTLHR